MTLSERIEQVINELQILKLEALRQEKQIELSTALRPGHRIGPNGEATATLEQACAYTGLSREAMLDLLEIGFVRYRKPGKEYRIPWVDLDRYLDGTDATGADGPSSAPAGGLQQPKGPR